MTKSTKETRQIHCKLDRPNYLLLRQIAWRYETTLADALNILFAVAGALVNELKESSSSRSGKDN